jgi:hypothetical protein
VVYIGSWLKVFAEDQFILTDVGLIRLHIDDELRFCIPQWLYDCPWKGGQFMGLLIFNNSFKIVGAKKVVSHAELQGDIRSLPTALFCPQQHSGELIPDIPWVKIVDLLNEKFNVPVMTKELPDLVSQTIQFNGCIPAMISVDYVVPYTLRYEMGCDNSSFL